MRCVYCYNPDIVLGKGKITLEEAFVFLRSRQGLLDGVVLSGGECTLHQKSIIPLLETVKQLGFAVKIDTNGSRPAVLEALLDKGLVDYVALDFKALSHRYHPLTRSGLFPAFEQTLSLLNASAIPFEVRTTVHSDLISEAELQAMAAYLKEAGYSGTYYIQPFVNEVATLKPLGFSGKYTDLESLSVEGIRMELR